VWTLGMISALTEAGATSATFFETAGNKGVMDNGGPVFPMYHVFRAIAGAKGALTCEVADRFSIAAFAVQLENAVRLIAGNYTRTHVETELPIGPNAVIRRLSKDTAVPVMEQPDLLWNAEAAAPVRKGPLRLAPFEIVFVDQPILPDAF
jgi:hypothetical protein